MDYIDSLKSYELIKRKKDKLKRKRVISINCWKKINGFVHPYSWFKYAILKLFYGGKQNYYCRKIDKCYQEFSYQKNFLMVNSLFSERPLFSKELFSSLTLHKFEDSNFYIFSDYDYFLGLMFGNYMVLRDKKYRTSHHNNNFFINIVIYLIGLQKTSALRINLIFTLNLYGKKIEK